jgi:hypothetical protein
MQNRKTFGLVFFVIVVSLAALPACKGTDGGGQGGRDAVGDVVGGDLGLDGRLDGGTDTVLEPNTALIGAAGGTLSSDCGAVLVVPPNALEAEVLIRVTEGDTQFLDSSYTRLGKFCVFEPQGLGFLQPVRVTFPFNVAQGAQQPMLAVYWESTVGYLTSGVVKAGLVDWHLGTISVETEGFSLAGPISLQTSKACCSYTSGEDTFAELLAPDECTGRGGQALAPGLCADVCCQLLVEGVDYLFYTAGATCQAWGGTFATTAYCEPVCCLRPEGAVKMLRSNCDAVGGTATLDVYDCDKVCCAISEDYYDELPWADCADLGGLIAAGADCEQVCCKTAGDAHLTTERGACLDGAGTVEADNALCETVCCGVADPIVAGATFMNRAECQDLGNELDAAACAEVCCVMADGLDAVGAAVVSTFTCQELGGTPGDAEHCEEVCCATDMGGITTAVKTTKARCASASGTPTATAECDKICCLIADVVALTTRDECAQEGGEVTGDATACGEVCCSVSAFGLTAVSILPKAACDEAGSQVEAELCDDVCCFLGGAANDGFGSLAEAGNCSQLGGTAMEPEACDQVCCAISFLGISGAATMSRGACEAAFGSLEDDSACEKVCCLLAGGSGAVAKVTPRWYCDQSQGQASSEEECSEVCCSFSALGFSGTVKMPKALCDEIGGPVDAATCDSVCCILWGDADMSNRGTCQSFGGKIADVTECEEVCCRSYLFSTFKTNYLCARTGGRPVDFFDCVAPGTQCSRDWHCQTSNPCERGVCRKGNCSYVALYGKSCSDGDDCTGPDTCDVDGTCKGTDLRACTGKECGPDGCGGFCGECDGDAECVNGKCEGGSGGGSTCRCGDTGVTLTPSPCDWFDATECTGLRSVYCADLCEGWEDQECWAECDDPNTPLGPFEDGEEFCTEDCCITINCP